MKKFYCIKQHDLRNYGYACLSTICKQYGLKYPISKIRELAGTDREGSSALGIIQGAEKLGFSAKGVRTTNHQDIFGEISLLAIAHVIIDNKLLHYVVIYKVSKNEILVADPAKGIIKYDPKDFFEIWTDILIILTPTIKFQKGDESTGNLTRFFNMIKPQKRLLINIFLASILVTLL